MSTPTRYALTVMCVDKVGVVARLTRVIDELGGNIEELYQGVLQGYFVITLMATFTDSPSAEAVSTAIEAAGAPGEFVVSILPRREDALPPVATGAAFVLTIEGQDERGILRRLTTYLADRHTNIEDLSSHTEGDRFTVIARLTVPEGMDIPALRMDLAEILQATTAQVTLMHESIFHATNRVSL